MRYKDILMALLFAGVTMLLLTIMAEHAALDAIKQILSLFF